MGRMSELDIAQREAAPIIEWLEDSDWLEGTDYEDGIEIGSDGWDEAVEAYVCAMEETQRLEAEAAFEDEYGYYVEQNFSQACANFKFSFKQLKVEYEEIEELRPAHSLHKMVLAHAVTLLEVYLEDVTKLLITSNGPFLANALKNVEPFKGTKFKLTESFLEVDGIKKFVLKELSDHIYHNVHKTKIILSGILGNRLMVNIESIAKIIKVRHDIVHRNGRRKGDYDGEYNHVDNSYVNSSLKTIDMFVGSIQSEIESVIEMNKLM